LPRRPKPKPHSPGAEPDSGTGTGTGTDRDNTGDARTQTAAATGTALAEPLGPTDTPQEAPPTNLTGDPLVDLAAAGPTESPTSADEADPDDAGPIHGVGLTLLVADLDRSVGFYRDMLGFYEIDGGDGNAVLASGQTRLVLRAVPEVAPVNRRLMHLNLEVDDLRRVHDELKSKGVRFTYAPRAVNRGARLELWAAAFRDPDGHGIAIIEWRDRDQPVASAT
jgi:resuscitation-promoting factor RpfA